jgi:hypothetical protein
MPARGQQVESERRSRCSSRREACMSGQEHHKARQADGKQKRGRWLAHVMLSARPLRAKHLLCCHSAPSRQACTARRQVRLDCALGAYHRLASASVTLSILREDRRRICNHSRSHARSARQGLGQSRTPHVRAGPTPGVDVLSRTRPRVQTATHPQALPSLRGQSWLTRGCSGFSAAPRSVCIGVEMSNCFEAGPSEPSEACSPSPHSTCPPSRGNQDAPRTAIRAYVAVLSVLQARF